MTRDDRDLLRAAERLVPPGALIAVRRVADTDASSLTDAEAAMLAKAVPKVRRQSAAARRAARHLMGALGIPSRDIVKDAEGRPVWPPGIVGSLAHDGDYAIAVMAPSSARLGGLGVDIEPARPLPADIVYLVLTPAERRCCADDPVLARLHFVIKEAVYKAVNPMDGVFLDFHDVIVDLASDRARTRTGHMVTFAATAAPRLVAVAHCPPPPGI